MFSMNSLEQAHVMANARLWHRNQGTVTNARIALQFGLASSRREAERLCMSLGLYPWGKRHDTKLKTMTDYIKGNK